jgi:hypothetical protein
MKVIDYLSAKYRTKKPTTMLYVEAKVFGVQYPLPSGWLKVHGDAEITVSMAEELKKALQKQLQTKTRETTRDMAERGLQILERAWLQLKTKPKPHASDFLQSKAWKRLRYQALRTYGARCQACGATPESGARLNVDHIKPRALFPSLALTLSNLQVLCSDCNEGKGNWDMTDFRVLTPSE